MPFMEKIVCFVDNEFHTPLCNLCLNNQPLQMLVRLVFNPISLKAKGLKVQIKLIAVRVVDIKTTILSRTLWCWPVGDGLAYDWIFFLPC